MLAIGCYLAPIARADEPTLAPLKARPATGAVGDEMVEAARRAAAAEARQILRCVEQFEALAPKPAPDWATKLNPDSSLAASSAKPTTPNGTLDPALGGVAPTELRDRLYALVYSGRVSDDVYDLFRRQIMKIPLRLHAIPKFIERRISGSYAFFYMMPNSTEQIGCSDFCQGAFTF